jgi:hypothetical protein
MCALPSKSYSTDLRDAFLKELFPFPFEMTEFGFDVNGQRFLYKHTIETNPTEKNPVWQWTGLTLLKKFNGSVILEAEKEDGNSVWFFVPQKELLECIKGKATFSVPADDTRFNSSPRELVRLLRERRFDTLDKIREKLFSQIRALPGGNGGAGRN